MSIMQSLVGSRKLINVTFIGSATSTTNTITLPASSKVGDFAILFDFSFNSGAALLAGVPSAVVPSGWTNLYNNTLGPAAILGGSFYGIRSLISYRILTSDGSSTITGMNADADSKIILVFRPPVGVDLTNSEINSYIGGSTPPTQTLNMSTNVSSTLIFGHWARTVSSRDISGISNLSINEVANSSVQYVKYAICEPFITLTSASFSGTYSTQPRMLESFYVSFT